jgi:hypothetical protein
MGRRRPAGARRKGPTIRGEPSAVAAFERLRRAVWVCECDADHVMSVQREAHEYLSTGEWRPPLPDYWSVLGQGDDGPRAEVYVYGVDETVAGMLGWHLETVDRERGYVWGVSTTDWRDLRR